MNRLLHALRRLFSQPSFVAVFLLLTVSAASLNLATDYLKLHFRKRPVPLRIALDSPNGIPPRFGDWVQVSRDKPLDSDMQHVLGTDQYINRDFVNVPSIGGEERVRQLQEMSADERGAALEKISQMNPQAVMHLGVTYYTGLVDTVAHIPDRCLIGDGFDISSYQTIRDQKLGDRTLTFRYISFDDQTGRGRVSRKVAYFFHVNGHYESDPLGVRRTLQNLLEPYGYYAKVEIMTVSPNPGLLPGEPTPAQSDDRTLAAMENFLTALLPEVERCLPDWEQVHREANQRQKHEPPTAAVSSVRP